jgi:hypothetical protein
MLEAVEAVVVARGRLAHQQQAAQAARQARTTTQEARSPIRVAVAAAAQPQAVRQARTQAQEQLAQVEQTQPQIVAAAVAELSVPTSSAATAAQVKSSFVISPQTQQV